MSYWSNNDNDISDYDCGNAIDSMDYDTEQDEKVIGACSNTEDHHGVICDGCGCCSKCCTC